MGTGMGTDVGTGTGLPPPIVLTLTLLLSGSPTVPRRGGESECRGLQQVDGVQNQPQGRMGLGLIRPRLRLVGVGLG